MGSTRGGGMLNLLRRLLREQTAQDLAEYGIALATISIVAVVVAVIIAKDVGKLYMRAQNVIDSASSYRQRHWLGLVVRYTLVCARTGRELSDAPAANSAPNP